MDAERFWQSEGVLLAIAVAIVGASLWITPSTADLTIFGMDIPVLCTWRRLTGFECPGCGLTRSFTFMAHGLVSDAWEMNKLGPPLFLLIAAQIPYRLVRILRGPPTADAGTSPAA